MRELVIVGRPNSGKTMFALNFADYLGSRTVDITAKSFDGLMTCRHFSIEEAKRELCAMTLHKTRLVQSFVLKIPVGKTTANFMLTDTCGISESIHSDETIRRGMAQTLKILRSAEGILHIVDLTAIREHNAGTEIDREIYSYGMTRRNYVLLANKIDLPVARDSVKRLPMLFPDTPILTISALYLHGFREVKNYVRHTI